jgi:hypothetical protein
VGTGEVHRSGQIADLASSAESLASIAESLMAPLTVIMVQIVLGGFESGVPVLAFSSPEGCFTCAAVNAAFVT